MLENARKFKKNYYLFKFARTFFTNFFYQFQAFFKIMKGQR